MGKKSKRKSVPQSKEDNQEQIIAVMGPTGTGKSTFIEVATRQDGRTIGHTLRSKTSEIRTVQASNPRTMNDVLFVDTPGFDDTDKSDVEILSLIAQFLIERYKDPKKKLSGILYLHRISDNRMGGSPLKQLRVFANMCGKQGLPRVILVTTMWNHTSHQDGSRREEELRNVFWKPLIQEGSEMARFDGTYETAWRIVDNLLSMKQDGHSVSTQPLLPEELVDDARILKATATGLTLQEELDRLVKAQKEASKKLSEISKRPGTNPLAVQELNKQQNEIRSAITTLSNQIGQLKLNWLQRFGTFFGTRPERIFIAS